MFALVVITFLHFFLSPGSGGRSLAGILGVPIVGGAGGGGAHRRAGVNLQQAGDHAPGPKRNGREVRTHSPFIFFSLFFYIGGKESITQAGKNITHLVRDYDARDNFVLLF